jgi:hypothetical protein
MKLHFDKELVDRLIDHSRNAESRSKLYGMDGTDTAGVWLVGDQGVYLMSNGTPHLPRDENNPDERSLVCYADECNPETLDFENWWENKRASFGGDDGADFIEAGAFESVNPDRNGKYVLNVTPSEIAVISYDTATP